MYTRHLSVSTLVLGLHISVNWREWGRRMTLVNFRLVLESSGIKFSSHADLFFLFDLKFKSRSALNGICKPNFNNFNFFILNIHIIIAWCFEILELLNIISQ